MNLFFRRSATVTGSFDHLLFLRNYNLIQLHASACRQHLPPKDNVYNKNRLFLNIRCHYCPSILSFFIIGILLITNPLTNVGKSIIIALHGLVKAPGDSGNQYDDDEDMDISYESSYF